MPLEQRWSSLVLKGYQLFMLSGQLQSLTVEEASPEKLPFPETLFCPRTFVSCRDGKECVSSDFVCDGEKDCLDGSDEDDCTAFCSNAGMFQCLKGIKCIDERYRCDGVSQCPDGSDERNCWTPSESCALRCDRNGRCIPKSWLCDNKADCFDETDEQGCEQKQCSSSKFRCMNGLCLPRTMVCDGDNDCGDFSDEANCTISKPVHCQRGEVKCESGECILKEWKCDGANDCKDGSDEKECKFETIECKVAQWACARKDQCIPSFWQCDGEKDCRDGSDETRCEIQNCKHDMFRCKNFDCVPTEVVCDGKSDCLDSSDEGGKCNETCGEDCSLACFLSPIGPKCMCDKGFKLNGNRTLCIDINECKEVDPSPCSQSCVNQNGTYNCTCHPGYVLQPDGHQCKVTGTEPVLLVAVQFDLIIYKLRTLEEEILTSTDKRSMIFSVDYDVLDQKIFWMDLNAESIKWLTMGTNTKGTLVKGIKSDCIAVDWVGRNLYWTDGIAGHILATALNASWKGSPEYTVVIDEHLAQPRSLVLQPLSGIMYWSEIGVNSQIEQAGMDGKQRRILITEQLGWPTGLAVDLLSWKIYWSDDKFHSIGSATLDGTNIKVIQIENIQSPFALTVFEDEIYWSEIKTRTVQKMNKKTGKNASVLIKRHGQPYGLKVMHEVLQPKTDNPCQLLKCSHLCLLGPGLNGSCWCPTGFFLSINMWNCVPFKELHVLLLTLSTSVIQINLQKRAFDQKAPMKTQIAFLSRINPFSSMDYNVQNQSLVFAVKSGGYIATAKIKADPKDWRKVLFVEDSVTSIAVDWITGNIFWISTNKPFIQVGTSNGMYKTVVMSEDLYQPYCIAVFPSIGIMCYFDAGLPSQKNSGKIECADMDGTERRVLWRKSKLVTGLTFVDSGSRLYWADREYGTIESIRVDGSDYKVIRSGLHGLNAFTTGDEVLFWTMVANGKTKVWFSGMDTYEKRSFEMDQKVVDLKVYSSQTQQGSNGCSKNNGGCSQICLPNLVGHTCRCSSTHRLVNGTQCHEQLYCDEGARICKDGLKCILNNKICDHKTDCLDGSDEKNCEYNIDGKSASNVILPTLMAAPKTPASKDVSYPSSTLSVDFENPEYNQTNEDFERKMESRPCTSETCNMRGTCVVENDLVKCRCFDGYGGDFCEEGLKPLAVPLTVGTVAVLLVFVIAAGIFVLVTRRKALQRTYSSASSRTLTRQTAKDMEPLEAENREFSETFFNEAFDAEGTSRTMIETHVEDPKG
ncbi:low-density lipoprotein receptor-related protein 2-like [Mixophyes fleayi]|uniref:low-density lipoprotein receptor-related protein 2-like n=1 Tax=Mixophyes fleayi TaxID=3061075 RepID=UPI003F4D8D80